MSGLVPEVTPTMALDAMRVGRPVAARHGRVWGDALAHLLAWNLPPVASCWLPVPSANDRSGYVAYRRSPGCRAILVLVELHAVAATAAATITVTLAGATWIEATQLDGATSIGILSGERSSSAESVGFLDVSGVTVGDLGWIRIRWQDAVPAGSAGVARVHIVEVPRSDYDPVNIAADIASDIAWPFAGNELVDGSTTSSRGFVRLIGQIDKARSQVRRHIQLVTLEDVADAWACGNSTAQTPVLFNHTTQPKIGARARRLYTTSVHNSYRMVVRYTTQHATHGATLYATATSETAGTASTATLTLAASAGWSISTDVAFTLPTDGTAQRVRIGFEYKVANALATLALSSIAIIEDET